MVNVAINDDNDTTKEDENDVSLTAYPLKEDAEAAALEGVELPPDLIT